MIVGIMGGCGGLRRLAKRGSGSHILSGRCATQEVHTAHHESPEVQYGLLRDNTRTKPAVFKVWRVEDPDSCKHIDVWRLKRLWVVMLDSTGLLGTARPRRRL